MCVMATERAERGRGREREMRGRQGGSVCQVKRKRKREWGEGRPLIDDSDSVSRQMLLDQIDTLWVESRRLFTDRETRRREDVFREERRRLKKEQTDRHKTVCHRHGWARQRSHFLFFLFNQGSSGAGSECQCLCWNQFWPGEVVSRVGLCWSRAKKRLCRSHSYDQLEPLMTVKDRSRQLQTSAGDSPETALGLLWSKRG